MTVKEIRFNANTDTHDTDFKTRHLRQFLIDGHKIKATVIYKGRMITHPEIGQKLMNEILEVLSEVGKLEAPPKLEGKMLVSYLIPDKNKIQAFKSKQTKQVSAAPQAVDGGNNENQNKTERKIDVNA